MTPFDSALRTITMSSESQFQYNGPFSTYVETHSALIGFVPGLITGWSRSLRRDLRNEPHYALGGFLLGVIAGIVWRRADGP